jgi:hypothetical protein
VTVRFYICISPSLLAVGKTHSWQKRFHASGLLV